jgi:hypothetical protein
LAYRESHFVIVSRALAAIVGGYALTSACTILLTSLIPLTRAESVLAASLLSFVIYTTTIILVYAIPSLKRVWLTLTVGSLLMTVLGVALTRFAV